MLNRKSIAVAGGLLALATIASVAYFDSYPKAFDVVSNAESYARENGQSVVLSGENLTTGYVSASSLAKLTEELLYKRGGYLSNDIMPPVVFMDNAKNFEFGLVVHIRDFSRALRQDFSRNRSQSAEDPDLAKGDPKFSFDNKSWILPSTESEYKDGLVRIKAYLDRLGDNNPRDGQFYARADNLRDYLQSAEMRLGSYVQRLAAVNGEVRPNTDLAGDKNATQTKSPQGPIVLVETPFFEVDDNFYQARGYAFGLKHTLEALAVDMKPVLDDKNAVPQLQQIIRELDEGLKPTSSFFVLNGGSYGWVPNYSINLASYLSRANAGIINLNKILKEG